MDKQPPRKRESYEELKRRQDGMRPSEIAMQRAAELRQKEKEEGVDAPVQEIPFEKRPEVVETEDTELDDSVSQFVGLRFAINRLLALSTKFVELGKCTDLEVQDYRKIERLGTEIKDLAVDLLVREHIRFGEIFEKES